MVQLPFRLKRVDAFGGLTSGPSGVCGHSAMSGASSASGVEGSVVPYEAGGPVSQGVASTSVDEQSQVSAGGEMVAVCPPCDGTVVSAPWVPQVDARPGDGTV